MVEGSGVCKTHFFVGIYCRICGENSPAFSFLSNRSRIEAEQNPNISRTERVQCCIWHDTPPPLTHTETNTHATSRLTPHKRSPRTQTHAPPHHTHHTLHTLHTIHAHHTFHTHYTHHTYHKHQTHYTAPQWRMPNHNKTSKSPSSSGKRKHSSDNAVDNTSEENQDLLPEGGLSQDSSEQVRQCTCLSSLPLSLSYYTCSLPSLYRHWGGSAVSSVTWRLTNVITQHSGRQTSVTITIDGASE